MSVKYWNTVFARRISSEDSGDVPSYTGDSDDSYSLDLDTDASRSGQMNLLEEILDSLNTSAVEQGKLSAAKSLDFFRSMEDLDYSPVGGAAAQGRTRFSTVQLGRIRLKSCFKRPCCCCVMKKICFLFTNIYIHICTVIVLIVQLYLLCCIYIWLVCYW